MTGGPIINDKMRIIEVPMWRTRWVRCICPEQCVHRQLYGIRGVKSAGFSLVSCHLPPLRGAEAVDTIHPVNFAQMLPSPRFPGYDTPLLE